jgi:hypothetical protein
VLNHRHVEYAGVFEGAAHHARRHDAHPVIADGDRSRFAKLAHLGQFRASLPDGDGADGVKDGRSDLARASEHEVRDGARVVHRLGVRHDADVRVAAGCRSAESRRDVFFVFVTGFAQVCVQIDERGEKPATAPVHRTSVLGGRGFLAGPAPDPNDGALFDDDVDRAVQTDGGIYRANVPNDEKIAGRVHSTSRILFDERVVTR